MDKEKLPVGKESGLTDCKRSDQRASMIALSLTARIVLPGNGENIYIVVQLVLAI